MQIAKGNTLSLLTQVFRAELIWSWAEPWNVCLFCNCCLPICFRFCLISRRVGLFWLFVFLVRMLGALILWNIKMPSRLITDMGQLFVAFYPQETGVWVGKWPRGLGRWEAALWLFFLFLEFMVKPNFAYSPAINYFERRVLQTILTGMVS